jgi:hypothetical protein
LEEILLLGLSPAQVQALIASREIQECSESCLVFSRKEYPSHSEICAQKLIYSLLTCSFNNSPFRMRIGFGGEVYPHQDQALPWGKRTRPSRAGYFDPLA